MLGSGLRRCVRGSWFGRSPALARVVQSCTTATRTRTVLATRTASFGASDQPHLLTLHSTMATGPPGTSSSLADLESGARPTPGAEDTGCVRRDPSHVGMTSVAGDHDAEPSAALPSAPGGPTPRASNASLDRGSCTRSSTTPPAFGAPGAASFGAPLPSPVFAFGSSSLRLLLKSSASRRLHGPL